MYLERKEQGETKLKKDELEPQAEPIRPLSAKEEPPKIYLPKEDDHDISR